MEQTPQKRIRSLKKKTGAGFTLVEVLVSLSIFSIAITGVITVASRGGLTVNIVKNKITATYLADEGLELMRALRDKKVMTGPMPPGTPSGNWAPLYLTMIPYCPATSPCDIDIRNPAGGVTLAFPQDTAVVPCPVVATGCPLYYDNRATSGSSPAPLDIRTYGYYVDNYDNSFGTLAPSPFSRKLTMTQLTPDEVQVSSTVTWNEGSNVKTLTQTENLYNWYP